MMFTILLAIICIIPHIGFSQILGDPPPPPCTDPDDPTCPIDGGLSLLLAAGAAYGVKKYRSSRKKEEDVEKD